jgi:hypothetical protein
LTAPSEAAVAAVIAAVDWSLTAFNCATLTASVSAAPGATPLIVRPPMLTSPVDVCDPDKP